MRIQLVSFAGHSTFSPPKPSTSCLRVRISFRLPLWVLRQLGSPIPAESGGEVQNADRMVPPWGWKASLFL